MTKRQAKIEALGLAVTLLVADIDSSEELYQEWGKDADKVHEALRDFVAELELRVERLEQP